MLFTRVLEPDTYDVFVGACVATGFAPRIGQEAENIQTLLALVAAGLGITFAPQSVVDGSPRPGVAFRRVSRAPQITTAIVWPVEHRNPAVESFRRIALEVSAEL